MATAVRNGKFIRMVTVPISQEQFRVLQREAHDRKTSVAHVASEMLSSSLEAAKVLQGNMEWEGPPERQRKSGMGLSPLKGPCFNSRKRLAEEG